MVGYLGQLQFEGRLICCRNGLRRCVSGNGTGTGRTSPTILPLPLHDRVIKVWGGGGGGQTNDVVVVWKMWGLLNPNTY